MTVFYTNKYQVISPVHKSGEPVQYVPPGKVFTIHSVGFGGVELQLIDGSLDGTVGVDLAMLDFAFTASEMINQEGES